MPTAVYHHAPGWVIMISPGSQLRRPKQEKRKCFRVETATVSSHQSKGLARQYERLNRQKKIQWPSAYDSPSVWKGLEKLTNYKPNATQSTNRSPTTWTAFSVTDKQWKSDLPTPRLNTGNGLLITRGKNLAMWYISQYRGDDTIYCDTKNQTIFVIF